LTARRPHGLFVDEKAELEVTLTRADGTMLTYPAALVSAEPTARRVTVWARGVGPAADRPVSPPRKRY
jgi:hypothetical protein